MSNLFNTINLLSSSLKAREKMQQVYSDNIANADTPGFKVKRISFEDTLKKELEISKDLNSRRRFNISLSTFSPSEQRLSWDGNSVDVTQQLILSSKNEIKHAFTQKILAKKISGMMGLISELSK